MRFLEWKEWKFKVNIAKVNRNFNWKKKIHTQSKPNNAENWSNGEIGASKNALLH